MLRAAVARCVERRAFNADAIENALRHAPLDLPSSRLDLSDRPELAHVGNGIRLAADYDVLFESQRDSDSDSEFDRHSDSQASRRASAPGPETASEPPSIEPPLVDPPLTADRGADATPLAKTFASSPNALALCCSEVEPDPVPLPRKEDAA